MSSSEKNLFSCVFQEYLIYSKKKLKTQSYASAKNKLELHILPYFKNFYLEEITRNDIIAWEEYILKCNFTNSFNKNLFYVLSGFFEYCKKFYNFDKSIISDVGCFKKKYEKNKHDFYSLKEFNTFIRCVDDPIYRNFFNLMFYCGTRPGEAMALKFSDLNGNYLTIDKTIDSHRKREIGTPKTVSSNRTIVIDNKLKKELLKLRLFYEEKYNLKDDYFIFGGIKPLAPSTINRRKLEACKKSGIRPITLHQFRHSHTTLLMNKGILVNEVSRRLGHSKVSTTLDIYSHTDKMQEKRVYDTLNSLHSGIPSLIYKFIENIRHLLKH